MKRLQNILFSVVFAVTLAVAGCGGGGGDSDDNGGGAPVSIGIDPTSANMKVGETLSLTATVSSGGVTWSADPDDAPLTLGDLTADFAPAKSGTYRITVTANEDTSQTATAEVTVVTDVSHPAYSPVNFNFDQSREVQGIDAAGRIAGLGANGQWGVYVYDDDVFTPIDPPESVSGVYIAGINSAGQIVGGYEKYQDSNLVWRGFIYDGDYTVLDYPDATGTIELVGIDAAGRVFGEYESIDDIKHAFIYEDGQYRSIDPPACSASVWIDVAGIDAAGRVFGSCVSNASEYSFMYDDSAYTEFNYPNAATTRVVGVDTKGRVFGEYTVGGVSYGFLYDGEYTSIDYSGATGIEIKGVDAAGRVFGNYQDVNNAWHGFVYDDGDYTSINHPDATSSSIISINDSGQIVGKYQDSGGGSHLFVAK